MSHVLIVSEDKAVVERLRSTNREAAFEVSQTPWSQWDATTLARSVADVFLFDYRQPTSIPGGVVQQLAARLRQRDLPLIFIADFEPALRDVVQAAIGGRNVVFANAATLADAHSIQEMLANLIAHHDFGKEQATFQEGIRQESGEGTVRAFPHLTPELRNLTTGRLDARRISDLFAIPVNRLAQSLDVNAATVYKTSDAPALQARLLLFERIARALLRLVGSEEGLRIWLNTPEPDLDNEIPRDLILNGEGEAVAELLEDMQEGQPG